VGETPPDQTVDHVSADQCLLRPARVDVLAVITVGDDTARYLNLFSSTAGLLVEHLTNPATGAPVRDLHFGVVTSKVDLPTICQEKNGVVPNDGTLLKPPPSATSMKPAGYPQDLPWPPPWPYLSGDLLPKLGQAKLGSLASIYVGEAWSQTRAEYECRVTQFLQSTALALDGRNGSFLRPDSLLVVLLLADREDCSTKNAAFWSSRDPWRMAHCSSTAACYSGSADFYSVEHYARRFKTGHPLGRTIIAITGKAGAPTYLSQYGCKVVVDVCKAIRPTERLAALQKQIGTSETQQVSVHWIDACSLIKQDVSAVEALADKILRIVQAP